MLKPCVHECGNHAGILQRSPALRNMPPNSTFAEQIGLSARNFGRWYLPICIGTAGFYWATSPDGVFGGGEKPRTLSDSACT